MGYYVVVDLEMCNVPAKMRKGYRYKNEIIQIGAALMDENLNVIDKFSEYVKPQYGYLDDFISNLTGIKLSDLKGAPMIKEAISDFLNWLPSGQVTAISWSNSDELQLRFELAAKGMEIDEGLEKILDTWIDCQPQFSLKMKMDPKKQYSLEEALVATDICTDGRAHNGMVDAYNTALLYAKMQREEELVLNTYYKHAHEDAEPEHLSFCFGDLLAAAGF